MPGKTITTQSGEVPLGAQTSAAPVQEVAYPNAAMEKEAADKLAAESGEIFRGEDWMDLPNYYCPLCSFATLDGDAAVISHGMDRHPGVDLVKVQSVVEKKDVSAEEQAAVEQEVAEERPETKVDNQPSPAEAAEQTSAEEQVVTNG